ncbi:hypothetical protein J6590_014393 [Homalodisca vitripennis]|nr:hypothetical protein J6590_014393 [Homalodisca vitripennis]
MAKKDVRYVIVRVARASRDLLAGHLLDAIGALHPAWTGQRLKSDVISTYLEQKEETSLEGPSPWLLKEVTKGECPQSDNWRKLEKQYHKSVIPNNDNSLYPTFQEEAVSFAGHAVTDCDTEGRLNHEQRRRTSDCW